MSTISYSDHDPRETYAYRLGQKEAWEESREIAETERSEALDKSFSYQNDAVRAYQNMLDLIDAKLAELNKPKE